MSGKGNKNGRNRENKIIVDLRNFKRKYIFPGT
jgi:hypothetical protein